MADPDAFREVYRQLRVSQDKFVYTLLAAAGAAIGLAVSQTQGAYLEWVHTPLAGAVICWGISFFCGCRFLGYTSSSLYANAAAIKIASGDEPTVPDDPKMIAAAVRGVMKAFEFNSKRANEYGHSQFRFLVLGAVLYVSWHVLGMWIRTIEAI